MFILTLFLQTWLGIELFLPLFYKELSLESIVAASIILGISISTLIFFFSSFFFGFNYFHLLMHDAFIGCVSFILNKRRRRRFDYVFKESIIRLVPPFVLVLSSLVFMLPSYLGINLIFSEKMHIVLHEELALSSSFLYGCNNDRKHFFKIKHPDFFDGFATSRWLTAVHLSMLRLGSDFFRSALLISTTIFYASFFILIYSLALEFLVPFYFAPFTIFIPIFLTGANEGIACTTCLEYCKLNTLFQVMIGNRPMILTLNLSVLITLLLYRAINCPKSCTLMKVSGLITGAILPAVMHQAYITILFFGTFHCLFQCWRQKYLKQTLSFLVPLAFSFLIVHSSRYLNCNFLQTYVKLEPVYNDYIDKGNYFPFFSYWNDVFGIYPIFIFVFSISFHNVIEKQFIFALFVTFFFFNFIQLNKFSALNIYTYYPLMFSIGSVIFVSTLHRITSKWNLLETKGFFAALFTMIIVYYSLISIFAVRSSLAKMESMIGSYTFQTLRWIRKNTDKNAVFHKIVEIGDPLLVNCGRTVLYSNHIILQMEGFDEAIKAQWYQDFINGTSTSMFSKIVDYMIVGRKDIHLINKLQNLSSAWDPAYLGNRYIVFRNPKNLL